MRSCGGSIPRGTRSHATIRVRQGAGGDEIAVGEGAVSINGNGAITRVDASTHDRTTLTAVEPGGIGGIAVGAGAVWIAGLATGAANLRRRRSPSAPSSSR